MKLKTEHRDLFFIIIKLAKSSFIILKSGGPGSTFDLREGWNFDTCQDGFVYVLCIKQN